jgi:hypothetical protein
MMLVAQIAGAVLLLIGSALVAAALAELEWYERRQQEEHARWPRAA